MLTQMPCFLRTPVKRLGSELVVLVGVEDLRARAPVDYGSQIHEAPGHQDDVRGTVRQSFALALGRPRPYHGLRQVIHAPAAHVVEFGLTGDKQLVGASIIVLRSTKLIFWSLIKTESFAYVVL